MVLYFLLLLCHLISLNSLTLVSNALNSSSFILVDIKERSIWFFFCCSVNVRLFLCRKRFILSYQYRSTPFIVELIYLLYLVDSPTISSSLLCWYISFVQDFHTFVPSPTTRSPVLYILHNTHLKLIFIQYTILYISSLSKCPVPNFLLGCINSVIS